jgi:hypothetical protein
VQHRHMPLLVAAELPQHPVDDVLLHVHFEQQWRPRHPVLLVAAQSREACGAQAAIASSEYGVHLTSASVRESNCPTKSVYGLFVWSWAYEVCIQTKCEP